MFEGDNRGFSNKPSGTLAVTSRIWHRFSLDTASGNFSSRDTKSDPSKAPWSDEQRTYDGFLGPKGKVQMTKAKVLPNGVNNFHVQGGYGGVNHAMPLSPQMQENLGISYVPTLDVNYKIIMDVDRQNRHVDIVAYITGDGFPNCEAFVVDPSGRSVFLGTHVRKGAAPVTLMLNLNYPMIAVAIRLPIDVRGNFSGTVGDELNRKNTKAPKLKFQGIDGWNRKFLMSNANHRHCMALEKRSLAGCF